MDEHKHIEQKQVHRLIDEHQCIDGQQEKSVDQQIDELEQKRDIYVEIIMVLDKFDEGDPIAIEQVRMSILQGTELYPIEWRLEKKADALSKTFLGLIYEYRRKYENARKIYEEGCRQNCSYAFDLLGDLYFYGLGKLKKNLTKAISLYEKACELGCPHGFKSMGDIYYIKDINRVDLSKAQYYYEKACEMNSPIAFYSLGLMYYNGIHIKQDFNKAKKLFERGHSLGCRNSIMCLGDIYYHGHGVEKNYYLAQLYYERSYNLNSTIVIKRLVEMIEKDIYEKINDVRAIKMYFDISAHAQKYHRDLYNKYKKNDDYENMAHMAYILNKYTFHYGDNEIIFASKYYEAKTRLEEVQKIIKVAESIGKCDPIIAHSVMMI
jgi:hypothetical protein